MQGSGWYARQCKAAQRGLRDDQKAANALSPQRNFV